MYTDADRKTYIEMINVATETEKSFRIALAKSLKIDQCKIVLRYYNTSLKSWPLDILNKNTHKSYQIVWNTNFFFNKKKNLQL